MKKFYLLMTLFLFGIFLFGCNKNKLEKYNIEFYVDNVLYESLKIEEGNKISKPTDPVKEGTVFDGWYIDDEKWLFSVGTVSNDLRFDAKFNEINPEYGVVPVYQGMEASSINEGRKRNAKKDIEDEVLPTIDVIETEGVQFFARKGEKYRVTVHLYNPASYEILSFTLDGKKYQSYEFKDGSNSTELIIELDAPLSSGIKDLTIDGIKYVDGTEIKDVIMDGEKTISIGVAYELLPQVSKLQTEINTDSYTASFIIADDAYIMNLDTDLLVYLYDGVSIVERKSLKLGTNVLKFENLQMGLDYQYMIVGVFDALDSRGKCANVLYKEEFRTYDGYTVNDIKVDKREISFNILNNNESATFKSISLYHNDELINSSEEIIDSFTNLLSNTEYVVKLKYQFTFNDVLVEREIEYEIKTISLETPEVLFDSCIAGKKDINYKVSKTDRDDVITSIQINLYLNDNLVNTNNDLEGLFSSLLSDNNYVLEVSYEYDLNDGKGEIKEKVVKDIKTVALEKPSAELITNADVTNFTFDIVLVDDDNTASLKAIKIYHGEDLIKSLEDLSVRKVEDLIANAIYTFEVIYEYDLNDGKGTHDLIINKQIHTCKVAPTFNLSVEPKSELVDFVIKVTDLHSTGHIESIDLYSNDQLIEKLDNLSLRKIDGLNSNTEYKLVVVYQYDLDDYKGVQEIINEVTFKTLKETPNILVDSTVTKESIKVTPNIKDKDNAGNLEKIELYLNNKLIDTQTENYIFENLLSNTNYTAKVYYKFDLNNGEQTSVTDFIIKTDEKIAPIVDVDLVANKKSINYSVVYTDVENIFKFDSISISKDNIVLNTLNTLGGTFENLYANNNYEIVVKYSYDLNDGVGERTSEIIKTIKTASLTKPTVGVNINELTDTLIAGELVYADVDNLLNLTDVNLYQDSNLIYRTYEKSFNYSVLSNVAYKIVVNYSYDLLDGNGIVNESFVYDVTSTKTTPRIIFTPYLVSQNKLEYNLLISDNNVTGRLNMIALYQGGIFVSRLDETSTVVENLSSNTAYSIKVNYVYDFDDGYGSRELNEEYFFTTLKVVPTYNLESNITQKSALSVNHNISDIDGALTFMKLELYKGEELIETKENINDVTFNDLLSNTTYKAIATFECDLNNGPSIIKRVLEIKTLKMDTPSVNINLESGKTNINYSYEIYDADKISTFKDVKLYLDNQLVEIESVDGLYNGLYCNNEYTIVVTLINDYHDGKEPVEETYQKTIKTKTMETPTVDLSFSSKAESIEMTINEIDNDNVLNLSKIEIYEGLKLVRTIESFENLIFDELTSNTLYTFKVTYYYNLNDRLGNQEIVVTKDYSTLAYDVKILSYELLNLSQPKTNEDINIKLNLDNKSNVKVEYLVINGKKVFINGGDSYTSAIFIVRSNSISGLQTINVDKLGYHLNGIDVVQDVESSEPIIVNILSRLDVISIHTVDGSSVSKSNYHPGYIIKIDNPYGYLVTKVVIDYVLYDAIRIDDNHYLIETEQNFVSYASISQLTYIDELGNETKRNYSQTIYLDITYVSPDEFTHAINIEKISTPEQLLNMVPGKAYELTCDIDMTGYKWPDMDFDGYFDGNGHKISNISFVYETETGSRLEGYGIFRYVSGTFKNVYFENIYYNVEAGSQINFNLLGSIYNGNISSVLFSGNFNLNLNNGNGYYNYADNNPGLYIVDSLKINGEQLEGFTVVSKETYESEEFQKETLGWTFTNKFYDEFNGLLYTIVDDSYIIITGYNGNETNLIIPNEINGLPVIGISDLAFENCNKITSFETCENLLFIGSSIFKGCTKLTDLIIYNDNVDVLSSLGSIFESNSELYSNIKYIEIKNSTSSSFSFSKFNNVETVILPKNIESLEGWSLSGCNKLKHITMPFVGSLLDGTGNTKFSYIFGSIPSSLQEVVITGGTIIETYAFENCSNLYSITLPEGLTTIEALAFTGCSYLTNLTLPSTLTSIGSSAFWGCNSLTNVYYNGTIEQWCQISFDSSSGNPMSFAKNFYMLDENNEWVEVTEIIIPNTITIINKNQFYGFDNVVSFTLPSDLISIGDSAFHSCKKLTSIVFPATLTSIGDEAFYGCSKLTNVEFLGETPPTTGDEIFYSAWNNSTFMVYVPVGCYDAYTKVNDIYWTGKVVNAGKLQEKE